MPTLLSNGSPATQANGPTVGYFPYRPGLNPYQGLFAGALEGAGLEVHRIAPKKLLPLQRLSLSSAELLQLDWPHDWYSGRNALTRGFKEATYLQGLRQLRRRPCVWTAHNLVAHDAPDASREHRMIQALVDVCSGVIVMSEVAKNLLTETYRVPLTTRVSVIPHGHYIDSYPNTVSRTEARGRLAIPEAARVTLSFGRIARYKGAPQLIAAFAEMARPGDILLIAGAATDPAFVSELEALARAAQPSGAEIRIVAQSIVGEDVQLYFNACDIVALPFVTILNSGSLMLAMSFGKCFVAPAIGSIPEIAPTEGWFRFAAGENGALAAALRDALGCPDRDARGRAVLHATRMRFGWESIGARAAGLYRYILNSAPL